MLSVFIYQQETIEHLLLRARVTNPPPPPPPDWPFGRPLYGSIRPLWCLFGSVHPSLWRVLQCLGVVGSVRRLKLVRLSHHSLRQIHPLEVFREFCGKNHKRDETHGSYSRGEEETTLQTVLIKIKIDRCCASSHQRIWNDEWTPPS